MALISGPVHTVEKRQGQDDRVVASMIEKHARKEAEQDRKPQLINRTDPNQEFPEQPKTNDKQDA